MVMKRLPNLPKFLKIHVFRHPNISVVAKIFGKTLEQNS